MIKITAKKMREFYQIDYRTNFGSWRVHILRPGFWKFCYFSVYGYKRGDFTLWFGPFRLSKNSYRIHRQVAGEAEQR